MSLSRPTVSLYSALAVQEALESGLVSRFSDAHGVDVETTFDPTTVLQRRIEEGGTPDVVIAMSEAFDALIELGAVDPRGHRPLVSTVVGVAVAEDTDDSPFIDSVDAFVERLVTARSVAYSHSGASGRYFSALIGRLGVAEQVNERATILESGFTATALLDGRADVAIQQVSELRAVRGVRVVGPLPDELKPTSQLSIGRRSGAPSSADDLIDALTTDAALASYASTGLVRA